MKFKETTEEICKKLLSDNSINDYFYTLTYKRHLDDLKRLDKSKYRFNEKLATKYILVIESLKHIKGDKANQFFDLEYWQIAMLKILAGWETKNSKGEWVRRFNSSYIFIARKNGKSIIASGFAIADMILRPEQGGEIKICATKKEQAQIVYNDILGQLKTSDDFKRLYHSARGVITYKPLDTTISTLGNESTAIKEDGFNASIGIVDEYSAHGTRALYDIIESSMGSKKNPIMFAITTAGFYLGSPSVAEYEHCKKILLGQIEDENYFAFLSAPMNVKGKYYKKFTDESILASNPNIDVSVSRDFLFNQRESVKKNPEKMVSYLTKHENRFVAQSEIFIPIEDWKDCAVDKDPDLSDSEIKVIGLDLSRVDDFTAVSIMYKLKENDYYLKSHFFVPENKLLQRERQLRVNLTAWKESGYITATKGDVIDYDFVYAFLEKELTLNEEKESYNMDIELRYDPYSAKALISKIENELGFDEAHATRQGFLTLSAPTKLLLDLVKSRYLTHDNNPCMNWMVSNVVVKLDPSGNIKPDKTDPNRKIDGVASAVNCLDGMIEKIGEEEEEEVVWI